MSLRGFLNKTWNWKLNYHVQNELHNTISINCICINQPWHQQHWLTWHWQSNKSQPFQTNCHCIQNQFSQNNIREKKHTTKPPAKYHTMKHAHIYSQRHVFSRRQAITSPPSHPQWQSIPPHWRPSS